MAYNAKKAKNRRTLDTRAALRGMFGDRNRRPCAYCGKKLLLEQATFDHVRALSAGGYDKRKNGAIACEPCNAAKGSMSREAFAARNKTARQRRRLAAIDAARALRSRSKG